MIINSSQIINHIQKFSNLRLIDQSHLVPTLTSKSNSNFT